MKVFAHRRRRRATASRSSGHVYRAPPTRTGRDVRTLLRGPAVSSPAPLGLSSAIEAGTGPVATPVAHAAPAPLRVFKRTPEPTAPAEAAPLPREKPAPAGAAAAPAAKAASTDVGKSPGAVVSEKQPAAPPPGTARSEKQGAAARAAEVPVGAERPEAPSAGARDAGDKTVSPAAEAPTPEAKGEPKVGESETPTEDAQADGAPSPAAKEPGMEDLKQQVRTEARRQRRHPRASKKREEAQKASVMAETEQQDQSRKEKNTEELGKVAAEQEAQQARRAKYNADEFKAAFRKLVADQRPQPQTASDVKAYSENPPVKEFPTTISNDVAQKQNEMVEPLQRQIANPPRPDDPKKPVAIPGPGAPPVPAPVDPALATPKPRADAESEMHRQGERLDAAMAKNRLSDEQLAESREPSFLETLQAKQQAKQALAQAPGDYRNREAEILEGAQSHADGSLTTGLGSMVASNKKIRGQVFGGQRSTESQTKKRQIEIKKAIDDIYQGTVNAVQNTLKEMASKVKDDFAKALERQTKTFNENVRRRISDYYGDWRIDDTLFGPADVVVEEDGTTRPLTLDEVFGRARTPKTINPDVYRIFVDEKNRFLAGMDGELDKIAESVEAGLSLAATQIELGKIAIRLFKATLKGEELAFAEQLEAEVQLRFENLEGSIEDAREDLLQAMADQYTQTVEQLETTFNEINDELKKSWLDRAVELIETVGRTIYQLADLLLTILSRMASLIWDIIQHPIRFFETLVDGLALAIRRFVGNIGTYLQEAFWTWVTGATPAKHVRLSPASGVESLFDLVLQVLDLGPPALRTIVEKVLGREFMHRVDQGLALADKALEPVAILLTKGPVALWEHLRDTLGTLIHSTFERIKESVFFAFVEKGLKWIAGFFVPGGGFVKVVKAIFRAFQFVAANLDNIRHFFESVFDSMEEAIHGRSEGVAAKIIVGLKTGIVLALDFLAKQLGLGKVIDDVQRIIQSLRRPIVNAIQWLLMKVKPLVTKLVKKGQQLVARAVTWWKTRKAFTAEAGERHTLYFEGSEASARLMIRSEPQSYRDFIKSVDVPAGKQAAKNEAIEIAEKLDQAVARAGGAGRTPAAAGSLAADPSAQIGRLLDRLAAVTATFMPAGSGESSEPVYGPLVHGFGSSVRLARLTKKHRAGSQPKVDGGHWEALRRRQLGGGTYYVRGHLLNHNLGGPGDTWANLTPLTQAANNRAVDSMLHEFEEPVKKKVDAGGRVNFSVTAHYDRRHPLAGEIPKLQASSRADDRIIAEIVRAEQYIPTTLRCESYEVSANGEQRDKVAAHTVQNTIAADSKTDYQLAAAPIERFYVSEKTEVELQRLDGVTARIAAAIVKNKPEGGYRTAAQLREKTGIDWERAAKTKGLDVHLYRRS